MQDLSKQINQLQKDVEAATAKLKIDKLKNELDNLTSQSQEPNFWDDSSSAQSIMQQISKLDNQVSPWLELQKSIKDNKELLELDDAKLQGELNTQISSMQAKFDSLKDSLKLSGPYDSRDAIISIFAGAGGTDAQDWAQMLLRMYIRFFEKNNFKATVIEESTGDEAGLKSVTVEVKGTNVYGTLKSEQGVHRLVRLSPFNSDNLRQTSFAKVDVLPEIDKPGDLEIDDKDLKIDVYRSGGHGGQSVNTTDSAVRITHLPTGIVVAIQNERSQLQNRETAMTILRSRLVSLQIEQHKDKLSELKGPNQSAEWGNQIRSYVLHPYKQVKDLRTKHESNDPDKVLDGELEPFINAYLDYSLKQ
ncbi:MAG: peptide chain release factor 2 [bacterium]